jgi:hypothetical protein
MMFVPHRKHRPPRCVTGELYLYIYIYIYICSYLTGNIPIGLQVMLRAQHYFLIYRWCSNLTGSIRLHGVIWESFNLYIYIYIWCSYLTGNTPIGLQVMLRAQLYFLIYRCYSYLTGNTRTDIGGLLWEVFTTLHLFLILSFIASLSLSLSSFPRTLAPFLSNAHVSLLPKVAHMFPFIHQSCGFSHCDVGAHPKVPADDLWAPKRKVGPLSLSQ